MPTYDYRCKYCGHEESVFQTIGEYCRNPIRPVCSDCAVYALETAEKKRIPGYHLLMAYGQMERKLSVVPGMSGLANALAGDRHYDGMAATDGTPIDSRTKHREYMKSKGLAMTGDFTDTWASAAKEREYIRTAQSLPERKRDVREVVERAIQN